VRGVFESIVGGDRTVCADMLSALTFRADFPVADGKMSCIDTDIMGITRDWIYKNPTVIICEAGFRHGGINTPGTLAGTADDTVKAITCESIGDRMTWRMWTLGSIILHEYT
jgi:hypothetical protein